MSALEIEFLQSRGYGCTWETAGEALSAFLADQMGAELVEAGGREARRVMSFWLRFDSLTRTISAADALELAGVHYEIIAPPIEIGRMDGIEVLADETYGPRDTDMTPQLTNVKAKAGLQAVLDAALAAHAAVAV